MRKHSKKQTFGNIKLQVSDAARCSGLVIGVFSESRELTFAAAMRIRSSAFVTIGAIENGQLN